MLNRFAGRPGTALRALCLAAGALAASLPPAASGEDALNVLADGGNITVSVPANSYDDTSKLYLVWSDGDLGDKFSAWPLANRRAYAGTLSSAAATYQISADGIPAGSVVRAIVTSDVRLIDGWVSLGSGQYVNTGIKGNEAYGTEIKFRRTGANGTWASVIGSKLDNFTIGQRENNNNQFYLRYQGVNGGLSAFTWADTSVPHTILVKHSINDGKGHVNGAYVDGTKVTLSFLNDKGKTRTGPVGALGTDAGDIFVGSSNNGSGASSGRYCFGEWHYVKIYDSNGYDMLHLVPAIRGNTSSPEGVFYDKVTGTVFANAGSGSPGYDTAANVTETIPFTTAYSAAFPMSMTAYWTGLGDLANVNDPANWACTNAAGAEVAGAYPDTATIVIVRGATNFNVPAGQRLAYNELNLENCSLATDCDWRGLAVSDTIDPIYTLQYLDAPKNAYIDTGFAPNNNTRVVLDITVRNTEESWFGVSDDSSSNYWKTKAFAVSRDPNSVYTGFGNEGGGTSPNVDMGRHTIDYDKGLLKVDGSTYYDRSTSGQTFQLTHSIYLFAHSKNGALFVKNNNPPIRLHSCKIYDNGTLIRDYVPVKKGDVVGLYDKANDTYAWNAGSGAFVAGPALGDAVGFYSVTRPTRIDTTVDLAGHSLTLAHTAGTGTITDTAGGGELYFNVAGGATVENSTLTFAGQMKLVKDGAGTFTASKAGQTYTGGTVVMNGLAKSGVAAGPWGPSEALVTVADTGAAFDWNGVVSASATPYSFDIKGTGIANGGAIVFTPGTGAGYTAYCLADLTLSGDALVVDPAAGRNAYCGFIVLNRTHLLTLNGHALTIDAGDKFNFKNVRAVGSGTVVFMSTNTGTGGARMASFWDVASDFSSVTLDIAANCSLNFDTSPHVIGTFIDRRTADSSGNVGVTVLDRYQPMATSPQKKITLGDATHLSPVLDLSGLGDAFTIPTDGNYAFAFASGAAVTVYTGGWTIAVGDKLVSWDEIPSATFTLSYDGEDRQLGVGVRADGLYVKSTAVPAYARLDIESDPQTWRFYDANGTENVDWEGDVTQEMQVHFSSYEEYLAVKAANVTPGAYVLSGGFALPAGEGLCDMTSGFVFGIAEGLTIDVKGRALKLPASIVGGTKTFTVTSSVAGGELVVDVASGTTLENSGMSLTGSLRLVKTGAGMFVAAKAGQTYTGGTEAKAGWLKSGAYSGAWGPAKALVTIADGAAFDWAGKVDASSVPYSFVISGAGPDGAGAMISSGVVNTKGWWEMNCIADMELAADATVAMSSDAENNGAPGFIYDSQNNAQHLLTLNGHTLTIRHGCRMSFRHVKTVGPGTIASVDSGDGKAGLVRGISVYDGNDTTDLGSATLDVGLGCTTHFEATCRVGTFIDRRETYGETPVKNAMMTVLERFKPMTANLLKTITLGDAEHLSPVLDLGDVTGTFVVPQSGFAMTYATGATVTVNLMGERTDLMAIASSKNEEGKPSGYVLKWPAKPADVEFAPSPATKAAGFKLLADETGLLLSRRAGTVLIVR